MTDFLKGHIPFGFGARKYKNLYRPDINKSPWLYPIIFHADKSFNKTFFHNELLEEICFLNGICMLTRKAQRPVADKKGIRF